MTKDELINSLKLEKHREGGYFRRTYTSALHTSQYHTSALNTEAQNPTRPLLSSIYYMLTDDSPIGYFHRNQSDIIHYWHRGSSLQYFLISPQGEYSRFILGPNLNEGEQLQATVPGGYWKATELIQGEYGLLSEAVSPGFDYEDMVLATKTQMQSDFPSLYADKKSFIEKFCQL